MREKVSGSRDKGVSRSHPVARGMRHCKVGTNFDVRSSCHILWIGRLWKLALLKIFGTECKTNVWVLLRLVVGRSQTETIGGCLLVECSFKLKPPPTENCHHETNIFCPNYTPSHSSTCVSSELLYPYLQRTGTKLAKNSLWGVIA